MRFSLLFIVLTLIVALPAPLQAAPTMGCSEYQPATIDVKPVFEDVSYDTHETMLKIRQMADKGLSGTQSESWPVGLSVGQVYMRITSEIYRSRTAYDPNTCGQLKGIHVELGFVNNVIYVAHELPGRSCPYKTVLGHEEKHKTVDRELLAEYADKAKDFFADTAKNIGVLHNPSASVIETQIDNALNDAMDKFSGDMEAARKKRQKEVDSPEEYARVSASCDGTTMQIVQDRLELLEQTYPGISKSAGATGAAAPAAGSPAPSPESGSP